MLSGTNQQPGTNPGATMFDNSAIPHDLSSNQLNLEQSKRVAEVLYSDFLQAKSVEKKALAALAIKKLAGQHKSELPEFLNINASIALTKFFVIHSGEFVHVN